MVAERKFGSSPHLRKCSVILSFNSQLNIFPQVMKQFPQQPTAVEYKLDGLLALIVIQKSSERNHNKL